MDPNIYALVLDTLNRATSQDTEVLKPAEKRLQEWETEPGFYSVLVDIFSNHGIDSNVRWLAVMCFKNGVDRYWRRNAPNAITDEEKVKLRQGLLTSTILSEPVGQIATQMAVLISKVARFDCPNQWPNLVPDLLGALKAPQPLIQHRALLTFHHIVKTLASKRLAGDRRVFQELTATVYSFILQLWDNNTQSFLRYIQESAATELITESLEKALLCLRILRKLTIFGFKKPHENQDAVAFLNVIFERAKSSLECRKLLKGRGIYTLELCEKFIIHLTKVALGVLDSHPLSYVPLITPSLEFTVYYCFTEQGMTLIYERFTIQCLNIIKGVLQCLEYKRPKDWEEATMHAHHLKAAILTEITVCHMCRHLVTHYFLLSSDDLALWDAEPESFATDEAGESWKYSLRPCTESVFLAFFHEYRDILAPELVRLLAMTQQQPTDPNDLATVLRKDAIYNAVGLAALDLYDEVDFDEWFKNVLIQELKTKDNNYRIIRRRVAWLIGQWAGVRSSPTLRPVLCEALLNLLSSSSSSLEPTEDIAVRLAAADALKAVVDDFSYDPEQFAPFARLAFSSLFSLLTEAEECDTKMHVLHVSSFIIERNGQAVVSGHATDLLHCLPQLWQHAGHHNMLRAAVVSTLVKLIKALGEWGNTSLRPFVLAVVGEATTVSEPAHVYLLEDALELWLAALETARHQDPGLAVLAKNLPPLLEETTEHLRIIVYIMQAYTLLSPEDFLMGAGATCMAVLEDMLSDMRTEGLLTVLKVAEMCLRVALPERNSLLGVKVVWPILVRVIRSLTHADELPMVLSVQLCMVSRVILRSPDLFLELVAEAAPVLAELGGDPARVLARVLDVWTDRMNLVTQVERWKIIGLALAVLLTTQNTVVLQRFPTIILNITEIMNDIMKTDENGVYTDALLAPPPSRPPSPLEGVGASARWDAPETPHCVRRRRLADADAPHAVDMRAYLMLQLETLRAQVGQETFDRLVQSVDPEVLQQLREYIPI